MSFSIELAAIDTARNGRRRYRIDAAQDLFGTWLVALSFDRIGARGRTIVHIAGDERQARRLVAATLRVRATAPRRIGVAYRECARSASPSWSDIGSGGAIQPATPSAATA